MDNQRKLELTLCGMLPYGLMVQYEGITNTKDFTEFNKKVKQYSRGYFFASEIDFEMPTEVIGLKIAPLKELHYYKKYFNAKAGIKNGGLKSFFNGGGLKPILNSMENLNKENGGWIMKNLWNGKDVNEFKIKSAEDLFFYYGNTTSIADIIETIEEFKKLHFNIYDLPSEMYIEKSEV